MHFNAPLSSADDDHYKITVTASTPFLVDLTVGNGLDVLNGVTVRFFDLNANLVAQAKPAFSDHAAFSISLPAGDYDMVVSADANAQLDGDPIDYRIRLATMPACDATTGNANYTEGSTDNDAIAVDFTKDPSFTMMSTSPEATSLTLDPSSSQTIAGDITMMIHTDQYLDRDTYEITTSDDANELAMRLEWDSATSDLDFIIFEEATMLPIIASNTTSNVGPELQMFAVKPSTKYLVWIGGFQGSSESPYRATLCANKFFY